MPACISDDRLPDASSSVVVIAIYISLIRDWTGVLRGCEDVDRFARECAVKIPDVDLAVMASGIDVSAICGASW